MIGAAETNFKPREYDRVDEACTAFAAETVCCGQGRTIAGCALLSMAAAARAMATSAV